MLWYPPSACACVLATRPLSYSLCHLHIGGTLAFWVSLLHTISIYDLSSQKAPSIDRASQRPRYGMFQKLEWLNLFEERPFSRRRPGLHSPLGPKAELPVIYTYVLEERVENSVILLRRYFIIRPLLLHCPELDLALPKFFFTSRHFCQATLVFSIFDLLLLFDVF